MMTRQNLLDSRDWSLPMTRRCCGETSWTRGCHGQTRIVWRLPARCWPPRRGLNSAPIDRLMENTDAMRLLTRMSSFYQRSAYGALQRHYYAWCSARRRENWNGWYSGVRKSGLDFRAFFWCWFSEGYAILCCLDVHPQHRSRSFLFRISSVLVRCLFPDPVDRSTFLTLIASGKYRKGNACSTELKQGPLTTAANPMTWPRCLRCFAHVRSFSGRLFPHVINKYAWTFGDAM